MASWTLSAPCTRDHGKALGAMDLSPEEWKRLPVLVAQESSPQTPHDWTVIAYFDGRPKKKDILRFAELLDTKPSKISEEKLPDDDWITVSQKGLEPICAGRFHVHTPDYPPSADGSVNLEIAASLAFGTGHHETTKGCLTALDAMRATGIRVDNMLDLGTGTGLLAFAANILWPRAYITASDIDPACESVVVQNIESNALTLGFRQGEIAYVTAHGLSHSILRARGPYDLITANILAGPLIELASDIGDALATSGQLILAGLLTEQMPDVVHAYRRQGIRLAHCWEDGEWSILWLRKRPGH